MSHCQIAVPLGVHCAFGRHKGQRKAKQISSTEGAQQEKNCTTREMKVDGVAFLKANVHVREKNIRSLLPQDCLQMCAETCVTEFQSSVSMCNRNSCCVLRFGLGKPASSCTFNRVSLEKRKPLLSL